MTTSSAPSVALPTQLRPADLHRRLTAGESLQLVDVREEAEFAGGRLAGARLLPLAQLERRSAELDRARPMVLVCRSGRRSEQAQKNLTALGFTQVACLDGGLMAWEAAGLPVQRDAHAPWAIERQVRIAAGALVLLGLTLGLLVHPGLLGISAFVGAGLVFAGLTDWCGMGLLMARAPWNRRSAH